jgi:pimeloyl-ACP methyl ester carboxylesterase
VQLDTLPFTAGDGYPCSLVHVRGEAAPTRGPILLVHGAGVRANSFRPPVERTLVDCLVEAGYDVWLENWRASIDGPPNEWTIDQAAVHDHPVAVRRVVEETGAKKIKAIVHCQGSTSFMMSAVAGLVPQVTTIVSNAVSLHPVIPRLAAIKQRLGVAVFRHLIDYMNPQWGLQAPPGMPRFIDRVVRLTHHECDNAVCRHVSFTYGAGFPTLWSHENLNEATHEWIKGEFAQCPMTFFDQIGKSIRAGRILAVEGFPELPRDVLAAPPRTDARVVFVAGRDNKCFLPESQVRSFEYFDRLRPAYHSLMILPGYGHLDVFMGKHAWKDVFPRLIRALDGPD